MRHIPNLLSFFRILLIPWFVWEMMANEDTLTAAVILAVSGLTDMLDGMLARRFNWISQLGKVLDPAADKLTQITVCVLLALKLHRYWFFFAILLLKEFSMLVVGGYLVRKGVKLGGAKWFGKVVTVLFYVTTTILVLFPPIPSWVPTTLLALTTVCAIATVLMYIPDFLSYKKEIPEDT